MLNLANKITILRMLITPVVIILLYFHGPVTCVLATIAFALAAMTDWIDGYVARRENMVTSMGKFLDPLADKVLICSVLIMFCQLQWAPAWVVIIIVCRELIVTGLRAMAIDEGIVLAADKFGKAETIVQIIAILPMLLHDAVSQTAIFEAGMFFLYAALALATISGINYCLYFYRHVRNEHSKINVR